MSEYEKQAEDFANKVGLKMECVYAGHWARFSTAITAVFLIVLQRPGKKPYSFEFSTSINDSWGYNEGRKIVKGLPRNIDLDKFFGSPKVYENRVPYREGFIFMLKKPPTIYDVLACLEKNDIGTFNDFCDNFGYSNDSIKAREVYFKLQKESVDVRHLFHDVMDELQEIN